MGVGAEQESKQSGVGIVTKEGERDCERYRCGERKKRLWLVVLTFGGRFRCNQSFAGATQLGQEMKCQESSVANGSGWGSGEMEDGE
jgi:hypothetical protein